MKEAGLSQYLISKPVFPEVPIKRASLVAQTVKNLPNAGVLGSIPGSRRSPGEGNGNPLQYSYLENSMDRGSWWAITHGVAKSWT